LCVPQTMTLRFGPMLHKKSFVQRVCSNRIPHTVQKSISPGWTERRLEG
jgi:hypothetical protein